MIIFTACSPAAPAPMMEPAAPQAAPTAMSPPAATPTPPPASEPPRAPSAPAPTTPPPPPPPAATQDIAPPPTAVQPEEINYVVPPIRTPSEDMDRRLVYTVAMRLQTPEFMSGMRQIQETVGEMGGYITYQEIWGDDMRDPRRERSSHMTFRIPTENLRDFLIMIEDYYNILWLLLRANDETIAYDHAGLSVDDLRLEELFLIDEIELAETPGQRTSLQRRLTNVRNEIRNFELRRAAIVDAVIYSTVDITLFETIIAEEAEEEEEEVIPEITFGERVNYAVSRSVSGFVDFVQGVVIFVILILPALVVIGAFAGIAFLIFRAVKKHNQVDSLSNNDFEGINIDENDEEKNE